MGEGQEIPEIRNMALSGSEPTKLEYYCRALTESCVSMTFLQKFKLHLGRALQESGPVNVSAATDVMWKTGWSRGHASLLSWNWLKRQCHVHSQDITELLAGKVRRLLTVELFC